MLICLLLSIIVLVHGIRTPYTKHASTISGRSMTILLVVGTIAVESLGSTADILIGLLVLIHMIKVSKPSASGSSPIAPLLQEVPDQYYHACARCRSSVCGVYFYCGVHVCWTCRNILRSL